TDVGTGAEVSTHVQDSAMEARLKKMEQQLSVSTQSQRKDKVEEALRNRSQDIPQTVKRARFEPSIPEWEIGLKFDPSKIAARDLPCRWVNYRGKALQPPFQHARAEEVASGAQFSLADLPFRDPDYFLAGNVCKSEYLQFWERINACEEVLDWIKYGVDVSRHFVHFKGDFRGVSYDSDTPPPILLSNSKTCIGYEEFILQSLLERVANGSMVVWGKVGEVEPPYLVMPLTVEPSKPRLCHDERFLNLWIKDNSFTLDTLKEVPRVIPKGSYMSNIDDKSGYDHISLSVNSRKYFGVQFGEWYLVYTSLPFGFKASAYIYQMTGMSVTSYCRQLGVPCLQYIDDRLIGEATAQGGMSKDQCGNPQRATAALYIVCEVLVRVGYFIGLRKSVFQPSQILQFLGMLVDSANQCFRIPPIKIEKFKLLRNSVLKGQCVDLNTLQRFAGKCISFMLAVPGAKLFIREVNRAIGRASKNSRPVMLDDKLREEIQHWEFMDTFTEWVPWRAERHLQVSIATDASLFRWGAVVGEQRGIGDFFPTDDDRPIHLKEADAVLKTIATHEGSMKNHRVDAHVDNRAVVAAWEGQGCRSSELNDLIKGIFAITQRSNIDLRLQYIPSAENPADLESRRKSLADCKLSESVWGRVQSVFWSPHCGPHGAGL
ncbi:uncharacterized protein, partial [Argopecten irradians]|uniref:uncharacterized protein n=1 Tax=Argopecten irradians TaxID=31199 RepID=UPI003718A773